VFTRVIIRCPKWKYAEKRTELIRKLRKGGWVVVAGGKHGKAVHLDKTYIITVPHGSNIDEWTAKAILKDAGLL